MKLTDESVAKALGWKRVKMKDNLPGRLGRWCWGYESPGGERHFSVPRYTTSVDAIVAEYRTREIRFICGWDETGAFAEANGGKRHYSIGNHENALALALCAALLAYLKESKP